MIIRKLKDIIGTERASKAEIVLGTTADCVCVFHLPLTGSEVHDKEGMHSLTGD